MEIIKATAEPRPPRISDRDAATGRQIYEDALAELNAFWADAHLPDDADAPTRRVLEAFRDTFAARDARLAVLAREAGISRCLDAVADVEKAVRAEYGDQHGVLMEAQHGLQKLASRDALFGRDAVEAMADRDLELIQAAGLRATLRRMQGIKAELEADLRAAEVASVIANARHSEAKGALRTAVDTANATM